MAKKPQEDPIGMIENDSTLERQRRREARRKKIIFAVGAVLLFAMLITVIFVFSKFFFSVREIEIKSGKIYSEAEILEASGVSEGSILFTVDAGEVSSRIQSELPFIVSVTVTRDYPGTLKISVK